jgi:hypothetical protein
MQCELKSSLKVYSTFKDKMRYTSFYQYLPFVCVTVPNPHHFDADPDTSPACHFDADLDPTFHFDADPDPGFQVKAQHLEKCSNRLIFHTIWPVRIQLIILMRMRIRIRILPLNLIRIRVRNTGVFIS